MNPSPMMAQVPSPMQEHIREHGRIKDTVQLGRKEILEGVLAEPVTLYLPPLANTLGELDLLIHFHGAPFVPIDAMYHLERPMALAVVQLGSGSSVYGRPFEDTTVFLDFIVAIRNKLSLQKIGKIYCSSFSAGYGAVRELLKSHFDELDGILLLDGLHTDYIPDKTRLADGGTLNTDKLSNFLKYAKAAVAGRKSLVITHSEIFPGTYASTTETSEWLLEQLKLPRNAVLKHGPVGMQQLAETKQGRFRVLAFAGNTAPDHVDHFHGMLEFLNMLFEEP
ncbi:hypothetical protein [Pareuzebyella sediminis]|uniref:hypothetical protein n=1 Tax=Pareuzebyella sediminis TaxID=2607998 RepID=UPI0011F04632|nr:hypothetical protein [Pareuzebyella sediminis]